MTAPAAIGSAQGTTFTFNSVSFKIRKIDIKRSTGVIETTTLDVADNSEAITELAPIKEGTVISVEGWDLIAPDQTSSHVLVCAKFSINGNAICTEYNLAGEVKGKLTFTASFTMTAVAAGGV
ncbi:hypothetical protein UFOVP1124_16 [uncultured Caudovirales phage]|uniref:Uncharacterized protein n=1 Tax=uncultured Caudovirales phage TaxID=2100421 RepID=A0A6J5QPV7_9CAUD|nr:hypothetical protein UFOVP1124_16 [uncultured Caudovirales phage]